MIRYWFRPLLGLRASSSLCPLLNRLTQVSGTTSYSLHSLKRFVLNPRWSMTGPSGRSYGMICLPGLSRLLPPFFLFVCAHDTRCSSHHKLLHMSAMVAYTFPLWSFTFWLWLYQLWSSILQGFYLSVFDLIGWGCNTIGFAHGVYCWVPITKMVLHLFVAGGWFVLQSWLPYSHLVVSVDGRCLHCDVVCLHITFTVG